MYVKTHVIVSFFSSILFIYWHVIWKLASLLKMLHVDHWKLDQQSMIVHYI